MLKDTNAINIPINLEIFWCKQIRVWLIYTNKSIALKIKIKSWKLFLYIFHDLFIRFCLQGLSYYDVTFERAPLCKSRIDAPPLPPPFAKPFLARASKESDSWSLTTLSNTARPHFVGTQPEMIKTKFCNYQKMMWNIRFFIYI